MRLNLAKLTGEERPYDRDKFTTRQILACDLSLIGKTNNEIAEFMEVEPSTVSIWLGDPRAHQYIAERRRQAMQALPDVMAKLQTLSSEVVNDLDEIRRDVSTKPELKAKIGFGLLDRAGYTPVQKVLTGRVTDLPANMVERMEETLKESREIVQQFKFIAPPETPIEDAEEIP